MADNTFQAAPAAPLTSAAAAGALVGKPAEPAKSAYPEMFEVDQLKPATEMAASGALIEPTIVERVPTEHPAIDDNPRAGQSIASNRLDMNDPTIPGHVATARRLGMSEAEPEVSKA